MKCEIISPVIQALEMVWVEKEQHLHSAWGWHWMALNAQITKMVLLFNVFMCKIYLRDQVGGNIMYQCWRPFLDCLISCLPQEVLQPAHANEPQLLHLRGCHLEFKGNMMFYNVNYVYHVIVMEFVLFLLTLIHLRTRLHIWAVCFCFQIFILTGFWHDEETARSEKPL